MNLFVIFAASSVTRVVLGMFIFCCILMLLGTLLLVQYAARGMLAIRTQRSLISERQDTSQSTSLRISSTRVRSVCRESEHRETPGTEPQ